eukprot:GHVN01031591.1.p2 GENE.GHVN01031591.1~~GHVN01031591.1.p2  ORF type:complete len:275 (+),score=35.69 GHVN01031591.1:1479-2303(+)
MLLSQVRTHATTSNWVGHFLGISTDETNPSQASAVTFEVVDEQFQPMFSAQVFPSMVEAVRRERKKPRRSHQKEQGTTRLRKSRKDNGKFRRQRTKQNRLEMAGMRMSAGDTTTLASAILDTLIDPDPYAPLDSRFDCILRKAGILPPLPSHQPDEPKMHVTEPSVDTPEEEEEETDENIHYPEDTVPTIDDGVIMGDAGSLTGSGREEEVELETLTDDNESTEIPGRRLQVPHPTPSSKATILSSSAPKLQNNSEFEGSTPTPQDLHKEPYWR